MKLLYILGAFNRFKRYPLTSISIRMRWKQHFAAQLEVRYTLSRLSFNALAAAPHMHILQVIGLRGITVKSLLRMRVSNPLITRHATIWPINATMLNQRMQVGLCSNFWLALLTILSGISQNSCNGVF